MLELLVLNTWVGHGLRPGRYSVRLSNMERHFCFFFLLYVVVVVLSGGSYSHNGMNGEVFVISTDALLDHINTVVDSPLSL